MPDSGPRPRPPDSGPGKAAIRTRLLAARRARDPAARARDAERVLAALGAALPELLPESGDGAPMTVAGYVPVGAEPGGPGLPEALRSALPGSGVLLPVLRADLDLDWAAYRGELVAAGRGLREPPGPRLGVGAVAGADLLVVPALAVDRRGMRLGRGGGSYDRVLARVPRPVPVVALLHDGELLDTDLPADPHDRRVTTAITPSLGLVRLAGSDGQERQERQQERPQDGEEGHWTDGVRMEHH